MSAETNSGDVPIEPDETARSIDDRFGRRLMMTVPDRRNRKLRQVMDLVNADDDLYGLWIAANVNAMERMGMTDHGPVHVKIVMNLAVRMLRLLVEAGIQPSVVTHYEMSNDDAEVVVALAATGQTTRRFPCSWPRTSSGRSCRPSTSPARQR